MFIGFNLTFLVQHSLGLSGMPRRVYDVPGDVGWTAYNLISTIGSFVLGLGILLTVINILRSRAKGVRVGHDPWKANTLEWFTTSPPPANNFDVVPRVRSLSPMQDIRRQIARDAAPPPPPAPAAASEPPVSV